MTAKRAPVPRVSVLMGVHNGDAYLEESVRSILGQSYQHWELILVNDGSTDGTGALIERIDDPRVKTLYQERSGLTAALIAAASLARGEYLARQDADDVSDAARLERQIEYLEANPAVGLLGTAAGIIDESGDRIGEVRIETEPQAIRQGLEQENQFVHGSIMIRRTAYDEAGGYRSIFRYSQDYDLVLRVSERCAVANLPREYYARRYTRDMISIAFNSQQVEYRNLARKLHQERLAHGRDRIQAGEAVPELESIGPVPGEAGGIHRYRTGYVYTCLRQGQARKARGVILEQIRSEPLRPRPYLHLAMTFLGDKLVAGVLKRWDARRSRSRAGA